jgi:hypothetical protein
MMLQVRILSGAIAAALVWIDWPQPSLRLARTRAKGQPTYVTYWAWTCSSNCDGTRWSGRETEKVSWKLHQPHCHVRLPSVLKAAGGSTPPRRILMNKKTRVIDYEELIGQRAMLRVLNYPPTERIKVVRVGKKADTIAIRRPGTVGALVPVIIKGVSVAYGRILLTVQPVGGKGMARVRPDALVLENSHAKNHE